MSMTMNIIKKKSVRERMWKSLNIIVGISTVLNVSMAGVLLAPKVAQAASQSASLSQCANDPAPSPHTDGCSASASDWVNGNLGASKSVYVEGDFVPYRMVLDNLSLASHALIIEWDTTKSSKHAIDYLGTVTDTVTTANPCLGVAGCAGFNTFSIPNDPQVTGAGVTPTAGNFRLYGGTITGVSAYSYADGAGFSGNKSARITITFTASVANPVLAWSGHIAHRNDWGVENSAVAISGSPYHTRLISLDGSGGNQDRSLSADAVIFPASITIVKQATPEGATVFPYTSTGGLSPASFNLVDDGSAANTKAFAGITNFTTYTVSETAVPGWTLTFNNPVCTVTTANGGSQSVTSQTVSIKLEEGENVSCTFKNERQAATVNVIKNVINDNGGTRVAADFTINASGANASPASFPGNTGTLVTVTPGVAYSITETPPSGYTVSYSADCNSSVAAGQSKTCTVTNNDVAPQLTVIKHVVNNNGGTAVAGDFTMNVTGTNVSDASFPGAEAPGTTVTLNQGAYSVDENAMSGYAKSLSADCTGSIAVGQTKTCTITNDDQASTLIVRKVLVNDNGGNAGVTDFSFKVNGGSSVSFEGDAENSMAVNAGTYSVVEDTATGYTTTYDNCSNVVIPSGGSATCVITNNDIAPTVTLIKNVISNNGGTAGVDSFGLTVGGNAVTSGQTVSVNANTPIALNEAGLFGYAFVSLTGAGCPTELGGTVTLNEGENVTCTITNDDVQPKLTVTKVVQNDNGGNAVVADFPLFVNATGVTSGVQNGFNAGSYTISETPLTGYTMTGISGDCAADGSVSLSVGQVKSCTITNNDVAPKLTVIKYVTNNNGGDALVSDFPLFVNGIGVTSGVQNTLSSNVLYTATETNQAGYAASAWGGDCAANGTITLNEGDDKTCWITNDDIAPTLKLVKIVNIDNGGTKTPADWTLSASGSGGFSDSGDSVTFHTVLANEPYTLSESVVAGYSAGNWICDGGSLNVDVVTLGLDEDVTCTITNDDEPGRLIIRKVVVNDNGGNANAENFSFVINDGSSLGFDTDGQNEYTVDSGLYTIVENQAAGYTTSYDNCTNVFVPNGGSATCIITNNDIAPTITLIKSVTNNNGGLAGPNNFGLTIGGSPAVSGQSYNVAANTSYALNEAGLYGYAFVNLTGDTKCPSVLGGSVNLNEGENVTCTIANDDIQPKLTVTKVVLNPNGGNAVVGDFPLFVGATGVTSGVQNGFNAGNYVVGETQQPGYTLTGITGHCDAQGNVNLVVGDVKSCTITNTDIAPTLTLEKIVINDDNGNAVVSNFPLFINSSQVTSGTPNFVNANALYTATETTLPGYAPSVWGGDCAADGTITMNEGENKTCTITNDDIAPTLTLVKTVINDNGGTATVASFPLFINDNGVTSGQVNTLLANTLYTASETDSVNYTASVWGGDCAEDGSITLNEGENKTCTITNDDIAANISVQKDGPETVQAGGQIEYTITWNVLEPGFAKNALIVDTLPSNTSYVAGSATCGTTTSPCTIDDSVAGQVSWSLGTRTAPDSGTVTVKVQTVDPSYNGTQVHNEVVFTTEDDEDSDDHNTEILADFEVTIDKSGPATVESGAQMTYTLNWTVNGNAIIDNLVITDAIPANTTFVSASVPGTLNAGIVTWNLGAQSPDASGSVTMTVAVANLLLDGTIISNTGKVCSQSDPNTQFEGFENFIDVFLPIDEDCEDDTTTTEVNSDFTVNIVKTDNIDPVQAGGQIVYNLAWSTTGNAPIANLVITDSLPANTTFVSQSCGTTAGTCTPSFASGVATWNLGPHNPGDFGSVTMTVQAASPIVNGTVVTNNAQVCGTMNLSVDGQTVIHCDTDDETTIVNSTPTISIVKSNNVAVFANPGNTVIYTVVVTNSASATDTARAVVLHDVLPAGFTYTIGGGTSKDFPLGDIAPGASVTTTYDVVISSAQAAGTFTNTASAKGNNTGTVSATSNVEVRLPQVLGISVAPSMTLTKTVNTNLTVPGGIITYTVTIKNTGDVDLTGVTLTDTLPAGFTFVEGGKQTKTFTIGTLAANHQRVYNYDVKVGDSVKNGKYENKAVVTSNELDPQTAKVNVEVRKPRVLGLATTGVGLREYIVFTSGLGLIALGLFWTGRLRRRYGRDQA